MSTTVVCVLRSGGDFRPEHVKELFLQVVQHWPEDGTSPNCAVLTDTAPELYGLLGDLGVVRIPLCHDYPRWWSKLELFRPDLLEKLGDILYFDLDTVIVGDLGDIVQVSYLTMLADFYRPDRLASGMMFLPRRVRTAVWERWWPDAVGHMRHYRGDQEFLQVAWAGKAERWQDLLPGQVISYKAHVQRNRQALEAARVVCFHGRPRPWQLPQGALGNG